MFQQLFESESSTYTYLLADPDTLEAAIIDPVLKTAHRDLELIKELRLKLKYILETHIHADHITGAAALADATQAKICVSEHAAAQGAQIRLKDGQELFIGPFKIRALATPGHTASCISYFVGDRVFTGDALLIRGNGRTDFQEGSAEVLYQSIHEKLFTLPDETLLYPAHDYQGFTSSSIGIEKRCNKRLGGSRSLAEFVKIMDELKLAPPKQIEIAVPANLKCGRTT